MLQLCLGVIPSPTIDSLSEPYSQKKQKLNKIQGPMFIQQLFVEYSSELGALPGTDEIVLMQGDRQ